MYFAAIYNTINSFKEMNKSKGKSGISQFKRGGGKLVFTINISKPDT
jgi:hypothetical protein